MRVSNVDPGISKYLRQSEAVSSKHYNFGAIEESARNHEVVEEKGVKVTRLRRTAAVTQRRETEI